MAGAIAFCFRKHLREISGGFDWRAAAVGLLVLALWLANYHLFYDTADSVPQAQTTFFIGIKLLGSSLVIPVVEELFFRSFLMRYLIKNDFLSVPLGSYTPFSFWFTAIAFAAMHPSWQWGAALIAGAAYGLYLIKTKNLIGCIIAHGATNLGIGLYILMTDHWALWL